MTERQAREVLGRIDELLGEDDGGPPPLGERVAECGRVVDAAEAAMQHAERMDEDTERGQRCARWNTDDAAAETAEDDTEGWQQ